MDLSTITWNFSTKVEFFRPFFFLFAAVVIYCNKILNKVRVNYTSEQKIFHSIPAELPASVIEGTNVTITVPVYQAGYY